MIVNNAVNLTFTLFSSLSLMESRNSKEIIEDRLENVTEKSSDVSFHITTYSDTTKYFQDNTEYHQEMVQILFLSWFSICVPLLSS